MKKKYTFHLTEEQVRQVEFALYLACNTQAIDNNLYKMFEAARDKTCPSCHGSGQELDFGGFPQGCPVCLGKGKIRL